MARAGQGDVDGGREAAGRGQGNALRANQEGGAGGERSGSTAIPAFHEVTPDTPPPSADEEDDVDSDASSTRDPVEVVRAAALKRGARIQVYWEEEVAWYAGSCTATRMSAGNVRQHHVKCQI